MSTSYAVAIRDLYDQVEKLKQANEALAARVHDLEQAPPRQPMTLKPRASGRVADGN